MFVVGSRLRSSEDEYVKLRAGLDEAQIKIVANKKTMNDLQAEREALCKQIKGLEVNLQGKDYLLSSQDSTYRYYTASFEYFRKRVAIAFVSSQVQSLVKIFNDEETIAMEEDDEDEEGEDDIQSKERVVTTLDVQPTPSDGDQIGDPAINPMDSQVTLPSIDKDMP